jgi:hypothetical protein
MKIKISRNEIQIFRKENPNPRKENQAGGRKIQIQALNFLGFPSPNRAFSKSYADPQGIVFFSGRFRPQTPVEECALGVRPGLFVGSRASGLFEASEGLAPFDRGCLGAVSTRPCRPRSLIAKKGILASPVPRVMIPGSLPGDGNREPAEKTGRSIRRPAEIRPRERSPNRFRAWISGRAPALHAFRSISRMPVLESYPFVSPIARRMRPLSVGRIHGRSSSSDDHYNNDSANL